MTTATILPALNLASLLPGLVVLAACVIAAALLLRTVR